MQAEGTFDPAHDALLRNRVRGDSTRYVLTPLRLRDGTAVLVDRGWIPDTEVTEPVSASEGVVVVRGVVHSSRPR